MFQPIKHCFKTAAMPTKSARIVVLSCIVCLGQGTIAPIIHCKSVSGNHMRPKKLRPFPNPTQPKAKEKRKWDKQLCNP